MMTTDTDRRHTTNALLSVNTTLLYFFFVTEKRPKNLKMIKPRLNFGRFSMICCNNTILAKHKRIKTFRECFQPQPRH